MRCRSFIHAHLAKRMQAIPLIALLLWFLSCSEDEGPTGVRPVELDSTWTFMMYDAADGDAVPIFDTLLPLLLVRSGPYVNLLALQDTKDDQTKILHINENNELVLLEELGELNMGSEETLYDFIMYAKEHFPADRYIMSFYGHGGAWFGACGDATSADALRVHEMKGALSRAGGVDLVFFNAPCLMGSMESVYELRNCTDIYIASEGMSCFAYWRYPITCAFTELFEDPTISNHALAELIIEEMWNNRDKYTEWGLDTMLTMCAMRTDRIEELKSAIDSIASGYLGRPDTFTARIAAVCHSITRFTNYVVDVNSLVQHLLTVETDPWMREKLEMIPSCLQEAVIAECHSANWNDVTGLNIFLPDIDFQYISYYLGEEDMTLDFAQDTQWDELMCHLVEQVPGVRTGGDNELLFVRDGTVFRFLIPMVGRISLGGLPHEIYY